MLISILQSCLCLIARSALTDQGDPERVRQLRCRGELFTLQGLAAQTRVPGGVCRGATAKLMCEAKGYKGIRLFDTFDGFPMRTPLTSGFAGMVFGSEEAVRRSLRNMRVRTSRFGTRSFHSCISTRGHLSEHEGHRTKTIVHLPVAQCIVIKLA
jgi:hypothetical protein